MTSGRPQNKVKRPFAWWTKKELGVVDQHVRALVGGRYDKVADAVESCRRALARLRGRDRGPGVGPAGRAWNTLYSMFLRRRRALGIYELHDSWTKPELKVLGRYLEAVRDGYYPNLMAAAAACKGGIERVERARRNQGRPVPHRSPRAILTRLLRLARAAGLPRQCNPWTSHEQAVLDRATRALVQGHYPNLTAAAIACRDELERMRQEQPAATAGVTRGLSGVKDRLGRAAHEMGWRWSQTRWDPAERRIAERYARELAKGNLTSVRAAAEKCWQEMKSQHDRREAGGEGAAGPALRTLATIETYLADWSRRLGRKVQPRWGRRDDEVMDRFADAIVNGTYLTISAAVPDCLRALQEAGLGTGRTRKAVAARLLGRAYASGLALRRHKWSEPESRILDELARAVIRGEYASAAAAVPDYVARVKQAGLPLRHPTRQVGHQLGRLARALGRAPQVVRLNPKEERVLDKFARAVAAGKYVTVKQAVADCRSALGRTGVPHVRSSRAVLSQLVARSRAHGRVPAYARWSAEEASTADRCARALARGNHATVGSAVAAWRRALVGVPLARTRSMSAIRYQLARRGVALGWKPVDLRLTTMEREVLDRFAQAVASGEYPSTVAALADCRRELGRIRPEVRRSDVGLACRLRPRVRAMGRIQPRSTWSQEENKAVVRFAGLVVQGRYRGAPQAAQDCKAELDRIRACQGTRGSPLPDRTLTNITGRLWHALARTDVPRAFTKPTLAERQVIDHYVGLVLEHHYPTLSRAVPDCMAALDRLCAQTTGSASTRTGSAVQRMMLSRAYEIDRRQLSRRRWTAEEDTLTARWARKYAQHRRGRLRMGLDTMAEMMKGDLRRRGYYRSPGACRTRISEEYRGVRFSRSEGRD